MQDYVSTHLWRRFRRTAVAIAASGIVTAPAVHANISGNIVVVPPSDLPRLARETGEALLLHEGIDGKTFLYIEQERGARLAIFDVSDPVHIKGEGSVQLGAAGPFDFVSPLGTKQELIKFRQGDEEAVLDMRKATDPNLQIVRGLDSHGPVTVLGDDGLIVVRESTKVPPARDFEVVDTASAHELNRIADVKQVRGEVSKRDTGTTFLLAEEGLYVVRRPALESDSRRREEEWLSNHGGE
jgi:hypothetical protein